MDVFAYPFATWRVYLHPTQRAVVDAAYKGPARVTGGPGTGKTVVALHRAHMLAQRGDGKVLVTTFTSTLSDTLQSGLDMLVDDEKVESRIEVSHVDRIAHRVFRKSHGAPHMLGSEDEKALWAGLDRRTRAHLHPRVPVRGMAAGGAGPSHQHRRRLPGRQADRSRARTRSGPTSAGVAGHLGVRTDPHPAGRVDARNHPARSDPPAGGIVRQAVPPHHHRRSPGSQPRPVAAAARRGRRSTRRHLHRRRHPPAHLRQPGQPARSRHQHRRPVLAAEHQLPHHRRDPRLEPGPAARRTDRRHGRRPGLHRRLQVLRARAAAGH